MLAKESSSSTFCGVLALIDGTKSWGGLLMLICFPSAMSTAAALSVMFVLNDVLHGVVVVAVVVVVMITVVERGSDSAASEG